MLSAHDHQHADRVPWRTLAVGLVHGMAGSAALIALAASNFDSPWWGLAYVLTFGLGTIAGMGVLSAIIAAPITLTARSLTFANRTLQGTVGVFTVAVGVRVLMETSHQTIAGF